MKALKTILILCAAICCFTACKKEVDMTLKQKTVLENADIWRIKVDDGWQVTLVYDSLNSFVELEYSAYLEDYVSVGKDDELIYFKFNKPFYKQPGSVFKATVHTTERQRLSLLVDNASVITIEELLEMEEHVEIYLYNASICNHFAVSSSSCFIGSENASQILDVQYSGSSCTARIYGDASCKGHFDVNQSFKAFVHDFSQLIVLGGNIPSTSIEVKDAGTINMVQAEVKDMSVYLDGASEAIVNVTETISGFLLSASTLYYKGSPQISIDCSDDSQLIPL